MNKDKHTDYMGLSVGGPFMSRKEKRVRVKKDKHTDYMGLSVGGPFMSRKEKRVSNHAEMDIISDKNEEIRILQAENARLKQELEQKESLQAKEATHD